MYRSYKDIIDLVSKPPLWWVDGVPRFEPFSPNKAIAYGDEVALVHCRCQCCGFRYDIAKCGGGEPESLRDHYALWRSVDIGDPPNFCCSPGHASTAEEIEILQFWHAETPIHWVRDQSMELPCIDHPLAAQLGLKLWPTILEEKGLAKAEEEAAKQGDLDAMADIWRRAGYDRPRAIVAMLMSSAGRREGEDLHVRRRRRIIDWLKQSDSR